MNGSVCAHIEGYCAEYSMVTYKYEWEHVRADIRVLINDHEYDYTWG